MVGRLAVYFLSLGERANGVAIVAVDLATGRRTTLAPLGKASWSGMTLPPDERRLLVSAVNSENLDLMFVEPPSRPVR